MCIEKADLLTLCIKQAASSCNETYPFSFYGVSPTGTTAIACRPFHTFTVTPHLRKQQSNLCLFLLVAQLLQLAPERLEHEPPDVASREGERGERAADDPAAAAVREVPEV